MDGLFKKLIKTRNIPEIRVIRNYHDHPAYIDALKHSITKFWQQKSKPNKLIMSFHGVPKKSLLQGDPYHCECYKTARLLTTALKLKEQQYQVTFQSRFGKAEWLKPYFSEVIKELGSEKDIRVDVLCPGFSSDCLKLLKKLIWKAERYSQNMEEIQKNTDIFQH